MFIPNVEAVTLLITVYTFSFGLSLGMGSTLVFCFMEGLIWGFDPSWLLAYFIHWPCVCITAALLKKSAMNKPFLIALIITFVTFLFGFQSTFTYFVIGGAIGKENWIKRYFAMYASGVIFYAVQCISSFISIYFFFAPLSSFLAKQGAKYFNGVNLS